MSVRDTVSSRPRPTNRRTPVRRVEQPQPTSSNFTDDVKTLDDESTPQIEGQNDVVSQPPQLQKPMGDIGDANRALGFEGAVPRETHDYERLGFPKQKQPLPDITQNIPTPAEKPQGDMRTGNVRQTGTERTGDNYTGTTQEEFDHYLGRKR